MKRVFLDTSLLVCALVESHPMHNKAFPVLSNAKNKKITSGIAAHTIAELYAVLTTLPIKPALTPNTVFTLIKESILPYVEIVSLSSADYQVVITRMSTLHRRGGSIYDALILQAAKKFKSDVIITLNVKHFMGYDPELDPKILEP